jgi:sugar phosphate permease
MLWLPLYFKSRDDLKEYSAQIPITYDIAAIFGSVAIGYLFKKIANKGFLMIPFMVSLFICFFILRFV